MTSTRCCANFKEEVSDNCFAALQAVGFQRYRVEAVDRPAPDGFHCWVGLNSTIVDGHVAVSPFVGLHVVQIMEPLAKLNRLKYSRGTGTYPVHMGGACSA